MNFRILVLACLLALTSFASSAQQMKIGYVNGQRLQQDSKRAQLAAEKLRQEFAARERELSGMRDNVVRMQGELSKLGPNTPVQEAERKQREYAALAQRFEQTRRAFEEDVARRKAEEREKFITSVRAVVEKIAKAQKLDIVLYQAVYASSSIDITNQVMKALDGS